MRKILVPCDFSLPAKEAFKFALEIASRSKGEVFVVHAIHLPIQVETTFGIQPYPMDIELINKIEAEAADAFNRLNAIYSSGDITVHFNTFHDLVLPVVLNFIRAHDIDLVVMGATGSSGFTEVFIGSNTEKVVRFSSVPVIALRKAYGLERFQHIVLPSDFGLNQTGFMNRIQILQEFFQATLDIIHINTPRNFITDREGHEALQEFANHYRLKNFTLNFRNAYSEEDGIITFAHEIQANLIAMGTHGRKGLRHLLKGSITEAVVSHLECPIWTYTLKHHQDKQALLVN